MLPRTYDEDDPVGVRIDTLVDARIEAEAAKKRLEDIYVQLDAIADQPEVFKTGQTGNLREMQQRSRELVEHLEEVVDHIDDELESMPQAPEDRE